MLLATIICMIILGSLLWLGLSRSQLTVSNDPKKHDITVLKPHSNDILTEFGDELSSSEPDYLTEHIAHSVPISDDQPIPIREIHPVPVRNEQPLPIGDKNSVPMLEREISFQEYLAQTEQHSTLYVEETLNQLIAQISVASDEINHIQQMLIEIQLLSDTQEEFQQIE